MDFARRTLILGGVAGLVGCVGDPTIEVPPGTQPRIRAVEEPQQGELFARAARLVSDVRSQSESAEAGSWRDAAVAQCDAQLARFNSVNPFAEPDPVFSPSPGGTGDLATALSAAVPGLTECADEAPSPAERLLFLSAAAATAGLANTASIPGEGADPSFVDALGEQRQVAIRHSWALVYGLEVALGRLPSSEPLREQVAARLASAKTLRNEIRDGFDGAAPSQPATFSLPTDMSDSESIREGWATLEVRLLESLVLLAADEPDADPLWEPQVARTQAIGGRIPRWPGWD